MKRKYADRPGWTRILDKSYKCLYIEEDHFHGHVASLSLNKVREKLWVTYGDRQLCIVDDGYVWLQYFPEGSTTGMYDSRGKLVQCI